MIVTQGDEMSGKSLRNENTRGEDGQLGRVGLDGGSPGLRIDTPPRREPQRAVPVPSPLQQATSLTSCIIEAS